MWSAFALLAALVAPAGSTGDAVVPTPRPSPATEAAERRALPAPLSSVFPSADFPGPVIGAPSGLSPGLHVYGWLEPGIELSTSHASNYPLSYQDVPNALELDQAVLRVEREPDTVQTRHGDWGVRLTAFYGTDYRFTTAEGYLSDQLLLRNQVYGFDPLEMYGILYFPRWGEGTIVQVGRYISPPDIEAQLAPSNFLYSHSLMFTFDGFTQTGVMAATRLSPWWTVLYGIHAGDDMAPWDPSAHIPTIELFGRWVSHANKDSVLFGIDALNDGRVKTYRIGSDLFGHDDLQQDNVTWTHVFTPELQNEFEAYWLYSFGAYQGGTINDGPFRLGAGGGPGIFLPGRSTAVGAVDYLEKALGPKDYLSFRLDWLNDPRGWRTGFATSYGSVTLGLSHAFSSGVLLRPEVRTERAFAPGVTPYDDGTRAYQTTVGADAIIWFGSH